MAKEMGARLGFGHLLLEEVSLGGEGGSELRRRINEPLLVYTRPVPETESNPTTVTLSSGWELSTDGTDWRETPVPSHWQLLPGLERYEGTATYRCRFSANDTPPDGIAVLRFGGVYYSAEVSLNGAKLGAHEGYLSPFEMDCTDALVPGENELVVEVYSPHEPEENSRETLGGVWAHWDGMDPKINPGGVFCPVELIHSGPVRLSAVRVEARPSGECLTIASFYSRCKVEIRLSGEVIPDGFDAPGAELTKSVTLESGHTEVEVPFHLEEPRLWWTRDRGEQNLYRLSLRCESEGHAVWEHIRFGVRSVEIRDWNVYVNGERIFLRGVNYLPTDAYPALTIPERVREDVRLLEDLDLNSVRVHVHVADGSFYKACDEAGILVLQDFPLQWTHRRRILNTAVEQAGEMARLLTSYPSVGVYLAHDEPFYVVPPEKWDPLGLLRTGLEAALPRFLFWQRRVLDTAVVKKLEETDPTTPVIEAAGHPLTTNHLYFGWYYGRFRDLARAVGIYTGLSRFPTEYGAQALPKEESLGELWPAGSPPDWDELSSKYRLQRERMELYVPWRGDRERYVRETQEYQGDVLRHATELFRVRKYRPTGGTFAFMLNDPARAISWSIVDWNRRKKAGYYALKDAMRPVLACAGWPEETYAPGSHFTAPLYVVNDLPESLGMVTLAWELSLGGEIVSCGKSSVPVPADSVVRLGSVTEKLPDRTGEGNLTLRIVGRDDSESSYSFRAE